MADIETTQDTELTVVPSPVFYFAGPIHVAVHTLNDGHRAAVMSAIRDDQAFVMFDGVSGEWVPMDRVSTGAETRTVYKI